MNITLSSFAFLSPSSVDTCRLSDKSVLLPTNMMMTSLPRSVRTSSIHFDVWWNELASEKVWWNVRGMREEKMIEQTCNIVNDNSNSRVSDVWRNQRSKAFLTRRVLKKEKKIVTEILKFSFSSFWTHPQLKSHSSIL